MAGKIIIEIQGEAQDHGDVRLDALIDQLDSLKRALSYAEQHAAVGGRRAPIYYRVVDLHHSLPTLEIEPVAEDPLRDRTGATIYEFRTRLRQIQAGRVPEDVAVEELEAYAAIAPKPERRIRLVNILFDAPTVLKAVEPIAVTREFEQKIAELIGPEDVAWGTLTGRLMAINLHERNVFYLFPRVGPKRIHCTFDRSIREDVKAAIDHYVEVAGRIHYRRRDMLAHRMTAVHAIDVLDSDPIPVKLSELRGLAPRITGEVDTETYLRELDEDWW